MHLLTVTEGISKFSQYATVRCFIDNDFHYGYWVSQSTVETLVGEQLVAGRTNKFTLTKEQANRIIEVGSTPYSKKFLK